MTIDHGRLFAKWVRGDYEAVFRRSILMVVALLLVCLGQSVDARTTAATASSSSTSADGWNTRPEVIQHHQTWIFTPSTTLPNGKHGLLIVLHGCIQTNTELKKFGNLDALAIKRGVVIGSTFRRPR